MNNPMMNNMNCKKNPMMNNMNYMNNPMMNNINMNDNKNEFNKHKSNLNDKKEENIFYIKFNLINN